MLNDDWDATIADLAFHSREGETRSWSWSSGIIDEKLTAAEDAFRRKICACACAARQNSFVASYGEKKSSSSAQKGAAVSRQQLATLRKSPKKVSTTDPRAPVHVAAHQQPNPPSPHRAGIDPTLLNEKVVDPPAHSRDEKQWIALKKKSKTWKRSLPSSSPQRKKNRI